MPTYLIETGNRFMMDSDSGSSDEEAVKDVDPYQIINKKTAEAKQRAQKQLKEQESQKKKQLQAQKAAKEKEEEEKASKQTERKKREPRANNGPRRGKRNENEERGSGDQQVNENKSREGGYGNANRRDNRRPRNQDRKSGDPRTGVKAQEKRGGAGKGNWGNLEEQGAEDEVEKQTPPEENENAENIENVDPENAENAEDAEPQVQEQTLEEYYSSMNTGAVDSDKTAKKAANDDNERNLTNKKYVSQQQLGFISDYSRGGNRNNDRGGRGGRGGRREGGRGGRRDFNDRQAPKKDSFAAMKMDDQAAFPVLSKQS